jgi:3-oxoacyl-(acyl-carrier-protein) synthase
MAASPENRPSCIRRASAIRPITLVSSDLLDIKLAAEVIGFEPSAWIEPKRLSIMDRCSQFAVAAAHQALRDAQLAIDEYLAEHVATIVGTGAGGGRTRLRQPIGAYMARVTRARIR